MNPDQVKAALGRLGVTVKPPMDQKEMLKSIPKKGFYKTKKGKK